MVFYLPEKASVPENAFLVLNGYLTQKDLGKVAGKKKGQV